MKKEIFIFILVVFCFFGVVSAAHSSTPAIASIDVGSTETITVDIQNTGASPITQVTITFPVSFTFQTGSEGTDSLGSFSSSTTSVSWDNATSLINVSATQQFSFDVYTATLGSFTFTINSVDDSTTLNVTVLDAEAPIVSLVNPTDNFVVENTDVSFGLRCSDNVYVSVLQLWTNTSGSWAMYDEKLNPGNDVLWEEEVTDLVEGPYRWDAYCEDSSGNAAWASSEREFRIDLTNYDPSSSYEDIILVLNKELVSGYKDELALAQEFQFLMGNEYHTLRLVQIGKNTTKVQIASLNENVVFTVGDIKKFEFTNDNFYDLSVQLHSVDTENETAEFTLKSLNESIPVAVAVSENGTSEHLNVSENGTEGNTSTNDSGGSLLGISEGGFVSGEEGSPIPWIVMGGIIVIAFVVAFMLYNMKKGGGSSLKVTPDMNEPSSSEEGHLDAQYSPGT